MAYNKMKFGTAGEAFAAASLENLGYKILDRNYRTKCGEIDIIAMHDDIYHFVEVKTRMGHRYGYAADAVDKGKQERMRRCAIIYLKENKIEMCKFSLDVFATEVDFLKNCV